MTTRFQVSCSTLGCLFNWFPSRYDDFGIAELVACAHQHRNPDHQIHILDSLNPKAGPSVGLPTAGKVREDRK